MSEKGPKYRSDGELGISKAWEDQAPDIFDEGIESYINSTSMAEQIDDGIEAITRKQWEARGKLSEAEAINRLSKSLSEITNTQKSDIARDAATTIVEKIEPKNTKNENKNRLTAFFDWAESKLRKLLGNE